MKKKIILGFFVVFTLLQLSACGRSFFGGPANTKVRGKVANIIMKEFEKNNLEGKLVIDKVEHNGFSQGGIWASYTYSEIVDGQEVSVSGSTSEFNDSGELRYDDSHEDWLDLEGLMVEAALEQPIFKKYQSDIYQQFSKYTNQTMTFEEEEDAFSVVSLIFSNDVVYEDSGLFEEVQWYDHQVKANLNSGEPNRTAFKGHFYIHPNQLLEKGIVTFRINLRYIDETKGMYDIDENEGHQVIDRILSSINTKKFPNGNYSIGFDVIGNDGTFGSISNIKYFSIFDGDISGQTEWGEAGLIENWEPNTSSSERTNQND